ncbi:MAG: sugar-binding domain-containing protein [Spirochaetia bacterium]|jgi:deoxyribonucleoside regulator
MDDLQKIVNVARMYYEKGLKQEDIARKVKISRASVSLILAEARRKGIVEITIRNPLDDNTELSDALCHEFRLERCIVVPTSVRETDILIELTASRAADIFNEEAKSGDTVGIAWGRTCYAFMSNYQSRGFLQGTRVVPLIGGSNRNLKRYQLNEMVRVFADKLKGTPTFIHAPALPSSREDYELYINSSSMKQMLHTWKKIDVAVISVGSPPVSQEFDGSKVIRSRKKIRSVSRLPVGDICARYFDIQGRFLDSDDYKHIIGIPVESLRGVKKIICVIGGIEKAYSLLGALRTGLLKILVTDEQTATAVMTAHREDKEGMLIRGVANLYKRDAAL